VSASTSDVRAGAHDLLSRIVQYFYETKAPLNEIIFVPVAIMGRILGSYDSINLLLENGNPVDAAIIVLTQFEMRLDLAWAAHDVKNATRWVDHAVVSNTPLKVASRIDKLFGTEGTQIKELYKHGSRQICLQRNVIRIE
jgi:hypothetical protein